jgi:hypothetical protein
MKSLETQLREQSDKHLELMEELRREIRQIMTRLYFGPLSLNDIEHYSESVIDDAYETIAEMSREIEGNTEL